MDAIEQIAGTFLAKRLSGELPDNDCSPWTRRAAKGMDVFRDEIRNTIRSMREGRIIPADALELIQIAGRGIDAFMGLDGSL